MAGALQSIDKDLKSFRDLSLWLWHGHKKPWEYEDEKARVIYGKISNGYSSISSVEELEQYLPNEEKVQSKFPMRKYLYLNPVEGQSLVPILTINSDFGRSIPELRIRLGLFLLRDGKPSAFGYRFESPEGPGNHHYYHAQLINGFEKDQPFLGEDAWLPTSCPTFPLDADNPVKLLLSLLIALYGVSCISEIRANVGGIEKHLAKMHFHDLPELKWYKKVIVGGGKKIEIQETSDPDEFTNKMKAKYQRCEVISITKEMFNLSSAGQSKKAFRKK